MRVGLVIDDIDPRRGGMSQWCWQFVHAVAKRSYELHVISQGFGDGTLPSQVVCQKIPRTKSRIVFAQATAEIISRLGLDVVHDTGLGWQYDIFQPHGGSYAAWQSRRLDIYPRLIRAFKRPIDMLLPRYRDFDRHWRWQYAIGRERNRTFVALSKMVADDFVRLHGIRPEQIKVVYNGVDCRRFSPEHRSRRRELVRQQLGIEDDTLVLLLAAHNFRLKGLPELLQVAARLAANRRRFHVVVAGGKHLDKWRQVADKLGVADRVTFLGSVPDMVPYYAAADAYVHPTYYDPCSLVLLEAAASGLAIVTTRRFNGVTELFRDGEEILTVTDPSDHEALYERVDSLFDEWKRRVLGTGARKVALQHPFEKNVAEILELYETRAGRSAAA
jgi:UDP-glucose:(heptosyl)LPS alpha-1,3-glucosyltransferase